MADQPLVGIIMGSKSDMPVMEACTAQLEELGVPYELVIASAHRNPDKVHEWAGSAAERGLRVIIAAAGKAAHLGGVVAAFTPLPIIGVPMKTSKNAAIYATQILGATMPEYREKIAEFKRQMAEA